MSDPRARFIDGRPATAEVAEYRELVSRAGAPPAARRDQAAAELVHLCRFRNRPAILRNNLRFGRALSSIRAADLDGDGGNELLVIDNDRTIHTLKLQSTPGTPPTGARGTGWNAGAHRYRGRMLGLSCTGFGVFHRQEAIVTSVEDHSEGAVYHELKLTCDGVQWDVSELVHRRPPSPDEGEIRLIGDSGEPGRVPVLRAVGGKLVVEILDDRSAVRRAGGLTEPLAARRVAELPREVSGLVLCEDELVVAYTRGGIQRITLDGRLRPLLFPNWRFSSLAYAPPHLLGGRGPASGLLCGGTTSGYVFAIDLRRGVEGVLWRMDAGFLFSCIALSDVDSAGRVDLLLGGMDGGLRIYELTDSAIIEDRCRRIYLSLAEEATGLLFRLAPPGHDAHSAVQLFLLGQILDSTGVASEVLVRLVNWFTPGQAGWHLLPERAQREAVSLLERYLVNHLPHLSVGEPRSTVTGPLPLISLDPHADPQVGALLSRTILAELVEVYLSAPRLVRRQIDRISRRLVEESFRIEPADEGAGQVLLPELQRLLNVRGLRAREYIHSLQREAEEALAREAQRVAQGRSAPGLAPSGEVLTKVLRAIGMLEEVGLDRFSMELERLDLAHAAIEPTDAAGGGGGGWVAGTGKNGALRVEPLAPAIPGEPPPRLPPQRERTIPPHVRFVEARRLISGSGAPQAGILVGVDEGARTRLLLFQVSREGEAALSFCDEVLAPGGVEPIGADMPAAADEAPSSSSGGAGAKGPRTQPGAEVLLLRVPAVGSRDSAAVLAVDAPGGRLRVRADLYPGDLLAATANGRAALHVTASRVLLRPRAEGAEADEQLSAVSPAHADRCSVALSEDGQVLAIGTAGGLVQILAVRERALVLIGQYLLPKGVSALCFIPAGVFGVPALAIGTEEEMVHIHAVGEAGEAPDAATWDGLELARLAVGGAPLRMVCWPTARALGAPASFRLLMGLQGGVVAAWDAPPTDGDGATMARLLDLAARAAGSRRAALGTALRGPGPHARAAAMREVLRQSRPRGITFQLQLIAELLVGGLPAESRRYIGNTGPWPLPTPERNHIVLSAVCEELVPLTLGLAPTAALAEPDAAEGGPGVGAALSATPAPAQVREARDLLRRVVYYCDDPLAIRASLLRIIERRGRPEHAPELLTWLPQLVLRDARSATWPFSIDSVGALFLKHLKRMDRAALFDAAEPQFFRNVAIVLEAVLPSQPSRFLLTEVALLLRSALRWDPANWAGNLGRARLHLPHSVIVALCQQALLPDPEARKFLLGVSRRWGPRMTMLGSEEDDAGGALAGAMVDSEQVGLYLDWIVEDGFDELYYERLADELTRFTRPAAPGEEEPDAWELADTVQAVLRLFDFGNLTELQASLQPTSAQRSLESIGSHRGLAARGPAHRYRDESWAFLDQDVYETERTRLLDDLMRMDRKFSGARLARNLDEVASRLDERRGRVRAGILVRLQDYAPPGGLLPVEDHGGDGEVRGEALTSVGYAGRLLAMRPTATVLAVMNAWWRVLIDEATRLRTEADFDVRQAADLGVVDGRRSLRYAVVLSPDTTRPARDVVVSVVSAVPPEVRVRAQETEPVDLEHNREIGILIDCPAALAADGMKYRVEIELRHDDGKRTERVIEGQFSREALRRPQSLFDAGFAEPLPVLFQTRARQLTDLLEPAGAAVGLVTAFAAHAHEILGEVVSLEWPDRPVDSFGHWRMVNLDARHGTARGHGHGSAPLRDILQQVGARLGMALGLDGNGMDRLDTVEALVRAVAEAPIQAAGGAPRGLLILGLPELCERAKLEEADQRQLLSLGARLCLAYRGRALVLLSPQAAAFSLLHTQIVVPGPAGGVAGVRTLELLDLDHGADLLTQTRTDEKIRAELERALLTYLTSREGGPHGAASVPHAQEAAAALIHVTGTDLRLLPHCLPVAEQALRERLKGGLGLVAFEGRVAQFLPALWAALPLPQRLYLAALCADSVDLELDDLRPGMVVDAPVNSISGKDRQPTSKVVVAAGVRLDARAVEDLNKVMWLKKVRVRGSMGESRSVLWSYLRQPRPRLVEPPREGPRLPGTAPPSGERWLELAVADLRRLGLVQRIKLGERPFVAFTSPAVRDWLRDLLGLGEGEAGMAGTIEGRNLVRQLPLWDVAAVDRVLGGNSPQLRAVLGWSRAPTGPGSTRWQEFLELSRTCRRWVDGQDEPRFVESLTRYFRLDPIEGTGGETRAVDDGPVAMRSVQIRFRDQQQLPWLKRVVLYLPARQPDRQTLELVQHDLRARLPVVPGPSGPHSLPPAPPGDSISDTSLSAIVIVPELVPEVVRWSRNLFHVAAIDVSDLQHAALHDKPVEELIRRLAAAASYAALSPFRSKMGLANQELVEEMFYGRRQLLEEIEGQRQENFIIVGPRKIGKTSLLQRVRLELEQRGYRVIPRGMDYTTAPDSRSLLRAMVSDLMEDLEAPRGPAGTLYGHGNHVQTTQSLVESLFQPNEPPPSLRQVVDVWARRHPDRSIAIVLDEIDTILRAERRAYLLGEWREAGAVGEALSTLLPQGRMRPGESTVRGLREALSAAGFTRDVIGGVIDGLQRDPSRRRASPLIEELRSASALILGKSAVCRVILAGHAELAEARLDLFGPLLNFAKLRHLGVLDKASAERMVREPFARLGLRFENQNAEQLLLGQTFYVPAWVQSCGALIIQSIDERLRSERREEQKITERDVLRSLESVHAEERAALQSENGVYNLGPECSFVLFVLAEESWFTVDWAVQFLRDWYEMLESEHRKEVGVRDAEFAEAFSHEVVRRIIRDLTNTFYLQSDETPERESGPPAPAAPTPRPRGGEGRLRRTYKVNAPMVRAVFREELEPVRLAALARRGLRLWREGRGVWSRAGLLPAGIGTSGGGLGGGGEGGDKGGGWFW